MRNQQLAGLRVAIVVTDGFEQIEMTEPRQALDEAGVRTTLLAPKPGHVHAMHHQALADKFEVQVSLDQANPDDYDAVLLPGGVVNADHLRVVPAAQEFVRRMDEANKPIAVICHGPWLLIDAGLMPGRTITSYHTLKTDIRNAGGRWLNMEAVRDRNWVSSRGPKDIPAFNAAIADLLADYREWSQQRAAA